MTNTFLLNELTQQALESTVGTIPPEDKKFILIANEDYINSIIEEMNNTFDIKNGKEIPSLHNKNAFIVINGVHFTLVKENVKEPTLYCKVANIK